MIKRSKLKCFLLPLMILTLISICIIGSAGAYQTIVSYTGFSWN